MRQPRREAGNIAPYHRDPPAVMRSQTAREINPPPLPRHVFEDRVGKRFRVIMAILAVLGLLILGFAAEFSSRVYSLKPARLASPIFDPELRPGVAVIPSVQSLSVVIKPSAYTDCGQGLLDFDNGKATLAGYIPFGDATALSGLRAHCRDFGVVYYQAFGFGAVDGTGALDAPMAVINTQIDLSDHISVEGTGPFSTHIARAMPGQSTVSISPESGLIDQQTYLKILSPRRIRLFGNAGDLELSLAFFGVGSAGQSEILLAELKRRQISPRFFCPPMIFCSLVQL